MIARIYRQRILCLAAAIGGAAACAAQAPLDRTVLPMPPVPYTNQIGVSYHDSEPQIHPPLSAPAGAPNIIVVLIDDAGYGQTGTFGGFIPTPTLDRLAAGGLRYTGFSVAGLCSPARAALLTGRNHHLVHMGTVAGNATAFPGYDGQIPKSAAFISEILRQNGYSTAAFGKWHLTAQWETTSSGPFDRWPTGQGFDYFYGFLGGNSDQWHPELFENTTPAALQVPPGRKADYTLNVAMADKAIAWIQREKSVTPNRPFFVYFAPGATHSPLQAPKAWIDRFKGKFDLGWDRYREVVYAHQKALGVIPRDAELTPRPASIAAWDSLSPDEKKVSARLMEVFAGFMAETDHEIGRVLDAVAATGQLDNTLILYIAGDNGSTMEGGPNGAFNMVANANIVHETLPQMLAHLDQYGLDGSSPTFPAAWGWAGNTPFQWAKAVVSHLGATRDPLVVSWPRQIKDVGGIRAQFHHLIDVVPTLLEAAGLPEPTRVDGVDQLPFQGVSMLYTFANASAPGRHHTQYFEISANRSIYHDGWIAGLKNGGREPLARRGNFAVSDGPWELYHLDTDYSERWNLAAAQPAKLKSMVALFMEEARRNQVFPLDPRFSERYSGTNRPSYNPGRTRFIYYTAPMELFEGMGPDICNHSFTISAEIERPAGAGDGVIVSNGGNTGGYSLFIRDGAVHFTYNYLGLDSTDVVASGRLPDGPATIDFEFRYDGGGLGRGGDARIRVNGQLVAEKHLLHTIPVIFPFYETFDIGEDAGTPVGDYAVPYRFQGKIRRVVFDLAPEKLSSTARLDLAEEADLAAAMGQ